MTRAAMRTAQLVKPGSFMPESKDIMFSKARTRHSSSHESAAHAQLLPASASCVASQDGKEGDDIKATDVDSKLIPTKYQHKMREQYALHDPRQFKLDHEEDPTAGTGSTMAPDAGAGGLKLRNRAPRRSVRVCVLLAAWSSLCAHFVLVFRRTLPGGAPLDMNRLRRQMGITEVGPLPPFSECSLSPLPTWCLLAG